MENLENERLVDLVNELRKERQIHSTLEFSNIIGKSKSYISECMKWSMGIGFELLQRFEFRMCYDGFGLDISSIEGFETNISHFRMGVGFLF